MSMSNTARISFNLNYQGRQPNFTRDQVESMSDLLSIPIIDDGHITYVKSVKKHYVYDSNNTLMSGLGKWRELAFTEVLSVLGINDVGDVADKDYPEHSLVVHNRVLYHINALWEEGDSWNAADVSETSILDEINALRGVSTESVVLTITPASVIPVGGVKANIYNQTSDSYSEEVTFTSEHNTHTLAEVNYGDIYTILMPSIDGYTQPADQTFKAGQMIRERTVNYVETSYGFEKLRLRAQFLVTGSSSIPSATATIRHFSTGGSYTDTTVSITGGFSDWVNIPWGEEYAVIWPTLTGYMVAHGEVRRYTASTTTREVWAYYMPITESFFWVMNDGSFVSSADDLTGRWNDLWGVATNLPELVNAGINYNFMVPKEYMIMLNETNTGLRGYLFSQAIGVIPGLPVFTGALPTRYDGEGDTQTICDYLAELEAQGTTVTSVYKSARNITYTFNGETYKAWFPSYNQAYQYRRQLLNTIARFSQLYFNKPYYANTTNCSMCTSTQFNETYMSVCSNGSGGSGHNHNSKTDYNSGWGMICIAMVGNVNNNNNT